jgi:hypothetical protein
MVELAERVSGPITTARGASRCCRAARSPPAPARR